MVDSKLHVCTMSVGYDVSLLIDLEKLPGSDKEKGEYHALGCYS